MGEETQDDNLHKLPLGKGKFKCNFCGIDFPRNHRRNAYHAARCEQMHKTATSQKNSEVFASDVRSFPITPTQMNHLIPYIDSLRLEKDTAIVKLVPTGHIDPIMLNGTLRNLQLKRFVEPTEEDKFEYQTVTENNAATIKETGATIKVSKLSTPGVYFTRKGDSRESTLLDIFVGKKVVRPIKGSWKEQEDYMWDNMETNTSPYFNGILAQPVDGCFVNMKESIGILNELKKPIPGVTIPYMYAGTTNSITQWHTEDCDLPSLNQLLGGEPASKIWYGIRPSLATSFEGALIKVPELRKESTDCPAYYRHKNIIASPLFLRDNNIPFFRTVQNPGDIIVTFPHAYHFVGNLKPNLAIASNYLTRKWIPHAVEAHRCGCEDFKLECPNIGMAKYVYKYYQHMYEPLAKKRKI